MRVHGLYEKQVGPSLYEKQAGVLGALGHLLGTAGAGHLGTNAVGLAAHHHSNVGDFLAHRGLQHGLDGQHLSPVARQSIKSIFGPESLITYEAGHGLAQKLIEASPHPDDRLRNMWGLLQQHVAGGTPVFGPLQKAVAHHVSGTAPVAGGTGRFSDAYAKALDHLTARPMHGMETGAQKVVKNLRDAVPAALFAGLDAVASGGVPAGAIGHAGWNGVRQLAGHTDVGQKLVAKEVVKGFAGERTGKLEALAYNLGASPAYLDARRLGERAAQHGAEVNQVARHPQARAAARAAMAGDGVDRLRQVASAVAPGATPQHVEAFARVAPHAGRDPAQALRDHVTRNRAQVERQVERHIEKTLGEPKLRLLPHIKVEPAAPAATAPQYTPARAWF